MRITLAQIRTFQHIAQLGTFQAAADALNLTQPSVSQRIRELETILGTELFVRKGPRVSLTAEGRALIGYADHLISVAEQIDDRFRNRDPLKGVLRLGINESFALVCLPELLRNLEERYPNLRISVHVGDTGVVSKLLNERKLDVGVVSEPRLDPHVQASPLGTNELQWAASPTLALPRTALTPEDIGSLHVLISPPGARLHATVTGWFQRAGVIPLRVSTCNSISATIQLIAAGAAIGLIPACLLREELPTGRLRAVQVTPGIPGHRVSLCHQSGEFGPGLDIVLATIRDLTAKYEIFAQRSD
jgi:DNA-binding transcriptional LysR family regulator